MSGNGCARKAAGFSLVELLVVMTLIAILLAIGISSFETNDGVPLGVAGEQFVATARVARERALAEGKPVRLAFLIGAGDGKDGDRRSLYVHVFDGEEEGWRLVADPEFFPEGIYLDTDRTTGLRAGTFQPRKDAPEAEFLGLVFRPDQFCEEAGARIVLGAAHGGDGETLEMKGNGLARGILVSRTGHLARWEMAEDGS